ncbi:hypothetical protein MSG28_006878 [Choristoneura fumiferana]|uniref:Uncharacterized protein n=1 Tax=Choristoneura fumiferana TaxID=7141 RepID=A0ACC0JLD7_CHOFU|nr:hypothetical protein MSG28_006878 [Choristoneura fumiferana]
MGSLERGVLTGFICRLCSDMHRVVLHIYGDEGIRMCISEKINRHLSINVSPSDPLPKTICKTCLEKLESQHRLVMRIEQAAIMVKRQCHNRVGLRRDCYVSRYDNDSNVPPKPPAPK